MNTSITPARSNREAVFAVAAVILAVAVFRILRATLLPELPNFSPVMAIAFCGGLFLPGLTAWILPLAAVVLSDLALSAIMGWPLLDGGQFAAWLALALGVGAGRLLARRDHFGPGLFLGLLLANGLIFYLVTNTVSWWMTPAYPHGLAGWIQAQTTGLPGYPPTWTFLRNALGADLVFAGLILAVRALALRPTQLVRA